MLGNGLWVMAFRSTWLPIDLKAVQYFTTIRTTLMQRCPELWANGNEPRNENMHRNNILSFSVMGPTQTWACTAYQDLLDYSCIILLYSLCSAITDHEVFPRPPRGHDELAASAVESEALAADEDAVDRPDRVRTPGIPKLRIDESRLSTANFLA